MTELSNEGALTPVSSSTSSGLNLSLFKIGPIVHVAIGATVASMVLVATTITIVVIAARSKYDAPTLLNDKDTTFKTTPKDMFVLKNDIDPKGAILTVTAVTQPPFGKVSIQDDGKFIRYTPHDIGVSKPHFAGEVNFKYQAKNDKIAEWANVTMTVLNHPPEAVSISYKLSKNSVNNQIRVLSDKDATGKTALDLDLDDLTVLSIKQPTNGKTTISDDKKFILYTPNPNFKSTDSFEFTITDLNDTATATVTCVIENDAPKANPDFYTRQKNLIVKDLMLLANDVDKNGDDLTLLSIRNTGVGQGFISADSKSAEYWPVKGAYGDSFEYSCTDGDLSSSSYVSMTMFNSPPVAGNVEMEVGKNTVDTVIPLAASDPDKFETLNVAIIGTYSGSTSLTNAPETLVEIFLEGTLRLIQWTKNVWTLKYTPVNGFAGDVTLGYTVNDGSATSTGSILLHIVNQAPIANPDFANVGRNSLTGVDIDVLQNDRDPNGDPMVLVLAAPFVTANGGQVSLVAGKMRYIPATGFFGNDTFSYTVRDDIPAAVGTQKSAVGNVLVTVANTKPIAVPDSYTVPRGNVGILPITANDIDGDNDPITISTISAQSVSGVTLTTIGGKNVSYPALSGAPYVDTFTYSVSDGADTSNTVIVTINVVNTAPTASDDVANVHWNNTITIPVLANDFDLNPTDIPLLVVHLVTQDPSAGTAVPSANGRDIIFTPNKGFVGVQTFKYRNRDPYGEISGEASVVVTVSNNAPIANNNAYTMKWGTTLTLDVIANDSDPDNDAIVVVRHTCANTALTNGRLFFTAPPVSGVITCTYTITDFDKEATAIVTVNVQNNAPIPQPDTASVHWSSLTGVSINALANDADQDFDPLTITGVSNVDASFGSATVVGGNSILFVPSRDKIGVTTFTYTVSDSVTPVNSTVQVTITNSDVPSASPKTFNTHWRTTLTRVDVMTALTDSNGDTLALTTVTPSSQPTLSEQIDGATGFKYYTFSQAVATYVGPVTWGYQISDGLATSQANVNGNIYNNVPTAQNYNGITLPYYLATTSGVTINVINDATDADTADIPFLTIFGKTNGVNGTVTVSGDSKSLTYVATRAGTDSFTFNITDGQAVSIMYTVTITTGQALLGSANKLYTTHWRDAIGGIRYDLALNLNGTDGKVLSLSSVAPQTTPHGSYTLYPAYIRDDSSAKFYEIVYTPTLGYLGTDSFSVATPDSTTSSILVSVTITNTKPVTPSISATYHWRAGTQQINVLQSATDPNSDPLTGSINVASLTCSGTPPATLVWDSNAKRANFTPSAAVQTCTFTYNANDGVESNVGLVTISSTNTAPITTTKFGRVHWSVHKTGYTINDLLIGDSDPNSDPISLATTTWGSPSPVSAGTLTSSGAKGVTLTALAQSTFVNNNVTFSYAITDSVSQANGQVNLYIYDQAPIASPNSYFVNGTVPQTPTLLDVLAGDTDPDQAQGYDTTLTIKSVSYSGASTIGISNGKVSYTPSAGFIGTETFTYVITDGMLDSAPAVITITVSNLPPIAVPDSASIMWNGIAPIGVTSNDYDQDSLSPVLLDSIVTNPSKGSVTIDTNTKIITYTPSTGLIYTGTNGAMRTTTDTFTYRIKDVYGLTAVGSVTITISNTPPVAGDDSYSYAKSVANPTLIFPVMSNDNDTDGNTITIKSIQYTSGNGATITTNGTHIFYLPSASFGRATDTFTYIITDGQLDSTPATVSVTATNQAPTCGPFSATVNKRVLATYDLNTLASPVDPNGDAMTWSLPTGVYPKATVNITGSVVSFKSVIKRSGIQTFTYVVSDGQLSNTCTATITIVNQAPTATPDAFNFKKGLSPALFDVSTNDFDVDEGDALSFVSDLYDGKINDIRVGGTISHVGFAYTFLPNATYQSPPSLNLWYTIKDDDVDNSLNSTAIVAVSIANWLPTVTPDYYSIAYGLPITVGIYSPFNNMPSIMSNDLNAAGLTDNTLLFISVTSCATLDPNIYCRGGAPIVDFTSTSSGLLSIPWSGSCIENHIQYCIRIATDVAAIACGDVVVQYTECLCETPVDVVFVLQMTAAITDQVNMVNFVQNTVNRLKVTPTTINVATVHWNAAGPTVFSAFSGDSKAVTGTMSDWKKTSLGGPNNIIEGILAAVRVANSSSRLISGTPRLVPKVIVMVTDGLPTAPCLCQNCTRSTYSSNTATLLSTFNVTGTCRAYSPTTGDFCMPCADPTSLAVGINTNLNYQKIGVNWRLISYGVGNSLNLYAQRGWNLVKAMNYDPTKSIANPWNDLKNAVPQLTDAICNIF